MARKSKMSLLAFLRKGLLLYLLVMVGLGAWLTRARSTDWNNTLWVSLYPVNGDNSDAAQKYIDALDDESFKAIETFVGREGRKFGITLDDPIRFQLGDEVSDLPPAPPANANVVQIMWWSLKLRHYARREEKAQPQLLQPDIRLFVVYHDPKTNPLLAHSLGIKEGLIGVVNGYASRRERAGNHVVIAHEILHTLGASDKYDRATNLPIYPLGYAKPNASPRLPQKKAEIMAGRIPLDETTAVMPSGLKQTVVGNQTAQEIRWIDTP